MCKYSIFYFLFNLHIENDNNNHTHKKKKEEKASPMSWLLFANKNSKTDFYRYKYDFMDLILF